MVQCKVHKIFMFIGAVGQEQGSKKELAQIDFQPGRLLIVPLRFTILIHNMIFAKGRSHKRTNLFLLYFLIGKSSNIVIFSSYLSVNVW